MGNVRPACLPAAHCGIKVTVDRVTVDASVAENSKGDGGFYNPGYDRGGLFSPKGVKLKQTTHKGCRAVDLQRVVLEV